MDTDGNIFVSMDHRVVELHHSSSLGGRDVATAGEIRVVKGEVQFVNRGSGHYQPGTEHLDQMMTELRERGIEVNEVDIGGF